MAKKRQAPGERASLLDKPRVLYAEPGYLSQGLFYGILLLLAAWAPWDAFLGLSRYRYPPARCAVGSVYLLFFLVLFLWKRPPWALSLMGIALWGAAVWYFFRT